MCGKNQTRITELKLVGFGNLVHMKYLLFVFFLLLFIFTLIGNTLIISLTIITTKLHSPMYFFLGNLSLCEILLISFVLPHILYVVWYNGGSVSLYYSFVQMYACGLAGITEILILTIMAFDRYLAICNPLRYSSLMNVETCKYLVFMVWLSGFTIVSITLIGIRNIRICYSDTIDRIFCEIICILEISSTDTYIIQIEILVMGTMVCIFPFILIILSYAFIFRAILSVSTKDGRIKTFSTCSPHLASVLMFFGAIFMIYLVPSQLYSKKLKKVISLGYTVLIPFLNPLIYSLRNYEMKACVMSYIAHCKSNIHLAVLLS